MAGHKINVFKKSVVFSLYSQQTTGKLKEKAPL